MLRSIGGGHMHYLLDKREISKFKLDRCFCPTCKSSGVPRTEIRDDDSA